MTEIIGYAGAFLLAICAIPQAILSLVQGHSYGLSHAFLWSWFLGELFTLYYILATIGPHGPLFYNMATNSVLLCIITWYRYFPRVGK